MKPIRNERQGYKMKVLAALLLTVLLSGAVSPSKVSLDNETSSTHAPSTIELRLYDDDSANSFEKSSEKSPAVLANEYKKDDKSSPIDEKIPSKLKKDDLHFLKPFRGPKEMLLQEIRILNEETKTQEEVAQTFKAEAKKIRPLNFSTTAKPIGANNATEENSGISKWVPDEDVPYEDDISEDEEDENDDEYDDGDEDDDENDDEPEYDEQVMTQCPDYCKCAGEYAAATTATCTKFVEQQFFGTGIVHLRIENAGQIRLGPLAFQSRGFQQLESIVITDTRIVELNQTAFDGIPYLFSVNLTRNDLQDIHPSTFQSNMQLSLLCISGNPLKHTQDLKLAKHGLFDAPSVTELDFSFNGLMKLKRTVFSKMKSLTYINLKGNKLKEIDSATFNMLESLVELDLSNNLLNEIPVDLFPNNDIQMLRVAGNNLISLNTIQASKLRLLDASNNKIKVIAKDDLSGVPSLDQLMISSNGLKRIHQHAFANLDQLNHLDISDNKLTSLTEHHLRANSRLQVLLMNNNPELGTLPIFKTFGFEYDTYSVYRFECSNCGLYFLEEGTFNAMPAITQLNLSRNRLMKLPNGLLSRLSSLRILDLSDNIFNTLESNMFRGATSLTKISLAGNPLTTLQVTPFLMAPGLTKLDVSRCALEKVWTVTSAQLTDLRSLSVRQNLLRRITVEELNATPKLVSLDLSHNPLNCDVDFNEAIQWLTDHAVTPIETLRYISNYGNTDNYPDSEGISQWTDLGKTICNDTSTAPQPRPVPHKEKKLTIFLGSFDTSENSDPLLRSNVDSDDEEEILKLDIDHGIKSNEVVEKAWTTQDQEYEDFIASENMEYHPWYTSALWPVIIVVVITSMILLLSVHIAIHLAKRRGQGPVIRPPMILRQGFIDNKNCGLVYKPLQEEIATPHVPKRGSFYSCSTFHYDKIVPESV
ncbi:PREDICTED: insulin-like growth factor-binding protein complex acid labile subunit isoform X1 [Eufriesea mexicana]|uniref:insulin-like growth factor-binding protein complex acid labile subunit isoform X1 n=2 Tax=Eufriesea mexicana TaxID=516756 RepID=UPI00083C4C34|nr:PREDICTED: insulin-like growth factor-binding protein complex acid labile subunit isoform X1 [Eufriesea mexicana]